MKKFQTHRLGFAAAALIFTLLFSACVKTVPPPPPALGPYDLDATLSSISMKNAGDAMGILKFRQDPDTARIITLDTYVQGLKPDRAYLLQRAVNPITDSSCSSSTWLTLGEGLAPQALHTDGHGKGHQIFFRDVTATPRGTQFRIHFQIVDSLTMTPVLASDCHEYTVR